MDLRLRIKNQQPRFYAPVYRHDEVQLVNQRESSSFQSHPRCKHYRWISRGRSFPTFPYVGTKTTSGLIWTIPRAQATHDEMLMIEVLVSSGTDTNRKKALLSPWSKNLARQAST